jgi:hypothetical protein
VLVPSTTSSVYLGEIDPNIPRPFSLLVVFKGDVAEGNYSILLNAYAIDSNRPASPYTTQATSNIQLKRATISPTQRRGGANGGIVGMLLQILRYLMNVFFGSASPFSVGYSFTLSALDSDRSVRLPIT